MLSKNLLPLSKMVFSVIAVLVLLAAAFLFSYKQVKARRLHNCSESPHTVTVPSNTGKPLIVLLGDSRISDWPTALFHDDFHVINLGAAGQTTGEALCQLDKRNFSITPHWYILQIGINDLVTASMMSPAHRLSIQENAFHNVSKIIEKLTAEGSKVLVLTIVPPLAPDLLRRLVWGRTIKKDCETFSLRLLHELPDRVKILDMRSFFYKHQNKEWIAGYSTNALHWNIEAYRQLTKYVQTIIAMNQ
jgi:lysophospholipase L1-like esterase